MYWHGGVCTVCIYALEDEQDLHKKGENQPEEIESIMYGTGRVVDTCSSPVHAGCRHSFFVMRALPAQRMWPEGRRLHQTTSCIHSRSGFHIALRDSSFWACALRHLSPTPLRFYHLQWEGLAYMFSHSTRDKMAGTQSSQKEVVITLHFLCTSTSRQRECLLYWASCVLKILVEKLRTINSSHQNTRQPSVYYHKRCLWCVLSL